MRKYQFLLFFCILFFWQNGLQAQFLLEGKVVDENGEGVILARIEAYKNENFLIKADTDFDGNFQLNLPDSLVILKFIYTGYKTNIVELDGKSHIIEVVLDEHEILEEVVITRCDFSRIIIEQSDTTRKEVITKEGIKKLPTRNIKELTKTAANFAHDAGDEISVRSGRSPSPAYYINGKLVSGATVLIPASEIGTILPRNHMAETEEFSIPAALKSELLEISVEDGFEFLKLENTSGEILRTYPLGKKKSVVLDLSVYPAGTYFLVATGNQKKMKRKLILEK